MISIHPATGRQVETALQLLVQHVPAEEGRQQIVATRAAVQRGELSLDGLLLAQCDGRPVGAMLTVLQPGASASLWPPETVDDDAEVADALLQAAAESFDSTGIRFAQSILDPADIAGHDVLVRNGFPFLTDMRFLERPLDIPLHAANDRHEFASYCQQTHARFANLLAETYRFTTDCPELDGLRSTDEAIASHKASGEFRPEFWRLYRVDSRDAALVLISEHPDRRAWELVYMGVAPQFRGRGLGRQLLAEVISDLSQTGADVFFLAVDDRNDYANRVYDHLGFEVIAKRALYLRMGPRSERLGN